jgi:hypothetical protein
MNFTGDGHLDSKVLREFEDRARRLHTFGDFMHSADNLCEGTPFSEFLPDKAVARKPARAGQHQVAHPGQSHQGLHARTLRQREASNLCQTARD